MMKTLAISDQQLRFITACCQPLPVEKRSLFLQRLVAALRLHNCLRRPDDEQLEAAARSALLGLAQKPAAEAQHVAAPEVA
jgi:hypothetical protein